MSHDLEWQLRDAGLDRTIEASFPASDPPSTDPNPLVDATDAGARAPEAPAAAPAASAGDAIPEPCELIEIRVGELKQLFHSIDPSPFREKDLDPHAEEFIVGWAREARRDAPLALLVHLDRSAGPPDEPAMLRDAVHEYFRQQGLAVRRNLRQLFRVGRTSLAIGLIFLGVSLALGNAIERLLENRLGEILRESLLIGGWVAMWRPLETFLYDWWPVRAEIRLFDRLSAMPVRIAYASVRGDQAWRSDWPAVPAANPPARPRREASAAAELH
jgi:hypothetical protein